MRGWKQEAGRRRPVCPWSSSRLFLYYFLLLVDSNDNITIQSLHQSYEDWLIHEKQGKLPAPVLVLDADQGIDNMITTYEQYKVGSWLMAATDWHIYYFY